MGFTEIGGSNFYVLIDLKIFICFCLCSVADVFDDCYSSLHFLSELNVIGLKWIRELLSMINGYHPY